MSEKLAKKRIVITGIWHLACAAVGIVLIK